MKIKTTLTIGLVVFIIHCRDGVPPSTRFIDNRTGRPCPYGRTAQAHSPCYNHNDPVLVIVWVNTFGILHN